jgi:hypothetical protein
MSRKSTGKGIELTERDIEIFWLLTRYRYLRSSHLHALVGGKSQKRFIERLGDLYHEGGYLNRPQQQWQTINARYRPAVYELGDAGERVLKQHGLAGENASSLTGKSRLGAVRQYHHELMICDIIASIEIGVRADPKLRFVSWQEILENPKMPERTRISANPLAIPASVSYTCPRTKNTSRYDQPLIPDALFGIEYTAKGQKGYRFFALEADRNTEPASRGTLQQSSYLRKILQYREIAARGTYMTHWGLPNLLVLNVTTNEQHMKNVMHIIEELSDGKGSTYLLFKTMPSLASVERAPLPTPDMLTSAWPRIGHALFFIDQI